MIIRNFSLLKHNHPQGIVWGILLCVLLTNTSCNHKAEDRLQDVFAAYQQAFPAATLQDVYKYCFQDTFGPAHIVKDSVQSAQYIQREIHFLDSIGWGYAAWSEPLQYCGKHVRVNILAVKEGKLTTGQLVHALMRSAEAPDEEALAQWPSQWREVARQVYAVVDKPQGYETDSLLLDQALQRGEYLPHHSMSFNNAYHYGYRLVRADVFEEELKPYLQ